MLAGARAVQGVARRWFSSLPAGASTLPMPMLSPTMEVGSIASWQVKEQTEFQAGSVLCEIETDKATVDYEAVDDGILARILLAEGSKDVPVGTPIAVVAEEMEVALKLKDMDLSFLTGGSSGAPAQPQDKPAQASSSLVVSPAAAILLSTYGVDPSSVSPSVSLPSRRAQIITKSDALKAISGKSKVPIKQHSGAKPSSSQNAAPSTTSQAPKQQQQQQSATASVNVAGQIHNTVTASGGEFEDVTVTTMRKVIATRLTEAKQSRPHFYATIDCRIDNILKMRSQLKKTLGTAPSINDVIVRAAALSLRDVPRVNCRLEANGDIVQNSTIDVAVAVATPTGLITPIVKNTDQKGVLQISQDMKDLAGRAKANKLKLDEFQGGSFTVSNLGMFGVSDFTAVISPPQSAILAVGGGRQEFDCEDENNLKPVNLLTVQISCDRRVIDDLAAGQFLQCFQAYMEEPMLMNL